jgi:hypothetical protein
MILIDDRRRWRCALVLSAALVGAALALLPGCPQAAAVAVATCKVVDVLHDGCMLLTFVGADGAPHTISCEPGELNAWGRLVEERHKLGAVWRPPASGSTP